MTEPPRRDDVIELLNRLGSDRDEDVLEAARKVHARITAAGTTWDELLVPEGGADDTDDTDDGTDTDDGESDDGADTDDGESDDGESESPDPEDEATRPAGGAGAKHADSIVLIDELLAKSDLSADMREELKGYKTDIAEGEFEARDRRYISAIHKRLSKRR